MTAGRPTLYSDELASRICNLIAIHPISLKRICDKYDDLPNDSTIYSWLFTNEKFSSQYLAAKESQAHVYSDWVMDYVANVDERTEAVAKANSIVNAAKWHLSKLAPKQFGDKKEIKQEMNISVHEDKLKELE
jgi:hypothetical protein